MKCAMKWLAVVAVALWLAGAVNAHVRIANCSDQPIYIVRGVYQQGGPVILGDGTDIGTQRTEGWNFDGWKKINPGQGYAGPDGRYYVQNVQGGQITWRGPGSAPGFINDGSGPIPNLFVGTATWADQERALTARGYRKVPFQVLTGAFVVPGPNWAYMKSDFDFNCHSTNRLTQTKHFPVWGNVVFYTWSADKKQSSDAFWTQVPGGVRLIVTTYGERDPLDPLGATTEGYYRGKLTVEYIRSMRPVFRDGP